MSTKTAYAEKLKDPRWQKKRLDVFNRDGFACQKCGTKEHTLHVHHLIYHSGHKPWEYELNELTSLCEDCHLIVEALKIVAPYDKLIIRRIPGYYTEDTQLLVKYPWSGPRKDMQSCNIFLRTPQKQIQWITFDFDELNFFIKSNG